MDGFFAGFKLNKIRFSLDHVLKTVFIDIFILKPFTVCLNLFIWWFLARCYAFRLFFLLFNFIFFHLSLNRLDFSDRFWAIFLVMVNKLKILKLVRINSSWSNFCYFLQVFLLNLFYLSIQLVWIEWALLFKFFWLQ